MLKNCELLCMKLILELLLTSNKGRRNLLIYHIVLCTMSSQSENQTTAPCRSAQCELSNSEQSRDIGLNLRMCG